MMNGMSAEDSSSIPEARFQPSCSIVKPEGRQGVVYCDQTKRRIKAAKYAVPLPKVAASQR